MVNDGYDNEVCLTDLEPSGTQRAMQGLWHHRRLVGPVGLVMASLLLGLCLFPALVPAHPVPGAPSFPSCRYPVAATRVALTGIAVTGQAYVYVADLDSDRIWEIDPSSGRRQFSWGCLGREEGQFDFGLNGAGIAVDRTGNIYVADSDNARIQRFDGRGHFMLSWSSPFPQLFYPVAVAVDRQRDVYAVDFDNARVLKFNSSGHFLLAWGSPGQANGRFALPDGIAIDGQDNVYVADRGNARIEKFDSKGHFLATWGGRGRGNGQFAEPVGIAVNRQGHVYVADQGNHRIELFDSKGHFLAAWNRGGPNISPTGIAVGGDGSLYAVSQGIACSIQIFAPSGNMVTWTC